VIDADAHRREVETWREGRSAALLRDLGWLTLAGFAWLREGVNSVGSAADADVPLPGGPSNVGAITVVSGHATVDGAFTVDGMPVEGRTLSSDRHGEPTLLEVGALRLCVIERGGRLAARTWDLESAARRTFAGVPHYPVDLAWRLVGHFVATPHRRIRVPDVLGIDEEQPSPGTISLDVAGTGITLETLAGGSEGELWVVFGDATNGAETYGGGRFLYTAPPMPDGAVVVDFNRAYNPPCVFSPYATCPLPWPANRLAVRIEAGERLPAGGQRHAD
jgi:uncharacterized protein